MFFILSKVLFFLLIPFWWIVILLIWRWVSKDQRTKKRLLTITIIILILFTNPFLYRSMVMLWQPPLKNLSANQKFDAGIILGGLAGYDKNGVGHFGGGADRFIQTANLYHRGIIKKIIVSGGTGKLSQDEPPEAPFLREEFILNGVHDSDIVIESRSRNTSENGIFSKRISDSLGLRPPFVLITSASHMRRSVSVFKKVGFDCIPFPCDYKVTPQKFSMDNMIIPNISLLREWAELLKEMVGLCIYKIAGKA
ncbi:MAG: YdcF family protein [Bacteroidota bacterium]